MVSSYNVSMGSSGKSRSVRPRFRVYLGSEIALGPGKADLLNAIAKTGSIQSAATSLKMSYMRAWQLVQTMNACFKEPLVGAERGGHHKGGAWLTPTGVKILKLYHSLEKESLSATKATCAKILAALRYS